MAARRQGSSPRSIRLNIVELGALCSNGVLVGIERVSLTLWRGNQLLGELRKRAPSPFEQGPRPGRPRLLSAVLVPAVDAPALSGMWQIHVPIGTFSAVEQFPIEPDIVAERYRRAAAHHAS